MEAMNQYDVVIVGGGPAGLSLAAALRASGLRLALVERHGPSALASPAYDGREIALTRRSQRLLESLGIWARIEPAAVSALNGARVLNADSDDALDVVAPAGAPGALGYLVSNHLIRRAAFAAVDGQPNLTLIGAAAVGLVETEESGALVVLDDGRRLHARLVVAADARFSATRRAMGIPARQRDFGKTMLVCRMRHERAHGSIALEWFGERQTLAVLPLNGNESSIVLTLPHAQIERLKGLAPADFAIEMRRRLADRLGALELASERYAYPLVAVYPSRFVATRFATVGDAAVGMHPVTAHGFNLGLVGVDALASLVTDAAARGEDIGGARLLARYDAQHRRATLPLYLATNAIVGLYTARSLPARLLRRALMKVAAHVPFVPTTLAALLMDDAPDRRVERAA